MEQQSDMYRRGMIFFHRGNLDGARRCFESALSEARQGKGADPLTAVLVQLANVYAALGERDRAGALYREVLSLQKEESEEGGADHRAVGLTLVNLGNLSREKGEAERARAYYLEGADRLRQAADDRSLGILYSNFGLLEEEAGRSGEAVAFFNRAIELHKKTGHEEGLAATWGQLGRSFLKTGKEKEAEICFNHAATHFSRLGDPAGEAEALRALSQLYEKRGDPQLALQSLAGALERARRIGWSVPEEDRTRMERLRRLLSERRKGPAAPEEAG
ncbi:MAG TPA: tetratricopeptide repeat protein [Candidatus Manganitrophaceae bacterium]|nr:tetratricopeptide repeat protein [Candidatus Manganitrophaceae bacterium]